MYLSEEILWPQFKTLNEVRNLPLQEQIKRYNIYLDQLNTARFQYWYSHQPKGFRIGVVGALLQENFFSILQENGSNILITGEIA